MDAFGTYVEGRIIVRGCGSMMATHRYRSCPVAERTSPGLVQVVEAHRRDLASREKPSAALWEAVDVVAAARAERMAKEVG